MRVWGRWGVAQKRSERVDWACTKKLNNIFPFLTIEFYWRVLRANIKVSLACLLDVHSPS